jgi:hypothetical protein
MLLTKQKIRISDVKPTKMISSKGKLTDCEFVLFKNGIRRNIAFGEKSNRNQLEPMKLQKIYTAELLEQIKREIDQNQIL